VTQTREELLAKKKEYYRTHQDALRAQGRAYYAAHRERACAHSKTYQAEHRAWARERNNAWYASHKNERREYELVRAYGISAAEYDTLLDSQGGACKICGSRNPGGQGRFHTDHDHAVGRVRGLLCQRCNAMLGFARDDRSILESAVLYLRGVV
jgi:hypothetical protein